MSDFKEVCKDIFIEHYKDINNLVGYIWTGDPYSSLEKGKIYMA